MTNPLAKFTVVELSQRIPGPFAAKILQNLGARIIKIEDSNNPDPFISNVLSKKDPIFPAWYESMSEGKEIIKVDLKNHNDLIKVKNLILESDAVISTLSEQKEVPLISLVDKASAKVWLHIKASKDYQAGLHDINALAEIGILKLHIENLEQKEDRATKTWNSPPFLPLAGISFGQKIATNLLANYIQAVKENTFIQSKAYLLEETKEIFDLIWPKQLRNTFKFLHSGAFPCYCIYKSKDQKYLALGAIEEKYWDRFCKLFPNSLHGDKRLSRDISAFEEIANIFSKLSYSEIEKQRKSENICLSWID